MDKIETLLNRGVADVIPSKEVLKKLLADGKKIRLYQGFDPTGSELHIGHMIGFRKLRQWQDLGHEVIFLIGDGTGQAGDPSGKIAAREKFFTNEELRLNAKNYVMQASKIVRFEGENPIRIMYNGDWLNKLTLIELLEIAGNFTLQQLIERDMYQTRIKNNESINMREFLYPLLQGYDSVAMEVDLELGGSDQLFNMLCGRTLVKNILHKEKFVMTTPLLEDSQGRKIGKSEGNVIALTDPPSELFGKIMSLGDDVIVKGMEYLTDIPMEEITSIAASLKTGDNPMEHKKRLAYEITKQLNNEGAAQKAQEEFEKTVQKKEVPTEIPILKFKTSDHVKVIDFVTMHNLISSKSEAKRLIEQKALSQNNKIIENLNHEVEEGILQFGKRNFVKIVVEEEN